MRIFDPTFRQYKQIIPTYMKILKLYSLIPPKIPSAISYVRVSNIKAIHIENFVVVGKSQDLQQDIKRVVVVTKTKHTCGRGRDANTSITK